MIGYIRLILAFMVLISHTAGMIGFKNSFHIGVFAVVIFYILAGHVITHLYRKLYNSRNLLLYYIDRFLRIYPAYILSLLIVVLFLLITDFGCPKWNPVNVLNNMVIIPLNYYMFINEYLKILYCDNEPSGWYLIPQAWSLGTELHAYILLPFLIIYRKLRIVLFITSIVIFIFAKTGYIHPDYWGYRLIPGVLFMFIAGSFLQDWFSDNLKKFEKFVFIFSALLLLALFLILVVYPDKATLFSLETISGYIIGTAILYLSLKFKNLHIPYNRMAGILSYAIFLNHFTAIWILKYFNMEEKLLIYLPAVTVITLLFSLPVVYIDYHITKKRFELTNSLSKNKKL